VGFDISSSLTNNYDAAGILRSYSYTPEAHIHNDEFGHPNDQIIINYTYDYSTEFGGYKVKRITAHAIKGPNAKSDTKLPGDGVTENVYDSRGQLLQQTI